MRARSTGSIVAPRAARWLAAFLAIAWMTGAPLSRSASATEPLFPILEDGRWGYIDRAGRMVIPPRFESLVSVDLEWRVGQTLPRGQRPRPADLLMSPGVRPETSDLVGVRDAGRWGFVDRTGALIGPPRFDQVGVFREGFAPIRLGEHWGFADAGGRIVVDPRFDEVAGFRGGLAVVIEGGRSGAIDGEGRFVLRPRFERVVPDDSVFGAGRAIVALDGKKGYARLSGTIVIPPVYRDAGPFREGLAAVETATGHGFIDSTGRMVIPARFEDAGPFDHGLAQVRVGGLYGFIDTTGALIVEPRFEEAGGFEGGEFAPVRKGPKFGWVHRSGWWIQSPFSEVERLDDTLRVVRLTGSRIAVAHAATGQVLVEFAWDEVGPFAEGMAAARRDGGKLGFIDSTGTPMIAPRFDWVDRFRHGLCRAVSGDTLGYVDRRGAWLWYGRFPGLGRRLVREGR